MPEVCNYANTLRVRFSVFERQAMRTVAIMCVVSFLIVFAQHQHLGIKFLQQGSVAPLGRLLAHTILRDHPGHCITLLTDLEYSVPLATPPLFSVPMLLGVVRGEIDVDTTNSTSILRLLQMSRKEGCSHVGIFIRNGRHLARLIQQAERLRLLDSRTRLIVSRDSRLFAPSMQALWRRLVNVVFVRRPAEKYSTNTQRSCFDLSTVTFPVPVDSDRPTTWQPKRIDTWCDGRFKYGYPLFPDKTKHLRYQPLRTVYYKHMPSAMSVPKIKFTMFGKALHGVEIEMLSLLARAMYFIPVLVETDHRSDDLVATMTSEQADLALGSLPHVPHFLRLLDLSQPYAAHCFTFLTPEVLGDLSWLTLLLPLSADMWLVSAAAFTVTCLTLHAVARFQAFIHGLRPSSMFSEPVSSLLYSLSMHCQVALPSSPLGWPLRFLFGCTWVHCLLLAVAYRASFASQLARPPPRFAVNSLEQLADARHLTCISWEEYFSELLISSQDPSSQKVGERLRETNMTELEVAAHISGGMFAFLENIHLLRHIARMWQDVDHKARGFGLHVMQECVATLPVSLGLARNSALTRRVDTIVQLAVEMGLIDRWLKDATSATRGPEFEIERQQALVNLPKMIGAFLALGVGFLLGLGVLFVEITYFLYKHKYK